jgi:hypothetical protein
LLFDDLVEGITRMDRRIPPDRKAFVFEERSNSLGRIAVLTAV